MKKLTVRDNEDIMHLYQNNLCKVIHTRSKTEPFFYRCLYYPTIGSDMGYEGESITQRDAYDMAMKGYHDTQH